MKRCRNLRSPYTEKSTIRIENGGSLLWAAALVLAGCCWVAPLGAQTTIGANVTFAATGQNEWARGDGLGFSSSGPQFLGFGPLNFDKSVGGIDREPFGDFGAFLGVTANAKVGINYNINANAGSLNLSYPVNVGFTVPTSNTKQVGDSFTIKFDKLTPNPSFAIKGSTILPRLSAQGPTIGAYANAEVDAHLHAGAEACFVDCVGPAIDKGIGPVTKELLALNMNNLTTDAKGVFRILGNDQGNVSSAHYSLGPLTLDARIPDLNADSSLGGTKGGVSVSGVITANNRENVLNLDVDIAKIAGDALGVQLSGKTLGIGWNLLSANAGLGVAVAQRFQFEPDLRAKLDFGKLVDVRNADGSYTSKSSVDFTLGQTVEFKAPNALNLQATPTYFLDNTTTNNTALDLTGAFNISALGANVAGEQIGPLIHDSINVDLTQIPLVNPSFHMAVDSRTSNPFNIRFNKLDKTGIDLCLIVPCTNSGLVTVRNRLADEGTYQDTIWQVPDYEDKPLFNFDGTDEDWTNLLISEAGSFVAGYSDPYLFDTISGEKVFFGSLADLLFNAGESLSVSNSTDEDAAYLLASTGFTGEFPSFSIPAGDSARELVVPEPSALLLLASGLAFIAGVRRKFNS